MKYHTLISSRKLIHSFLYALGLSIILAFPFPGQGAVRYVSESTGNDQTGDGSQGNPWATIGYAVTQAASFGDTVCVAGGFYLEHLSLNKRLALLGGFDPLTWSRNIPVFHTVIDGGGSGDVVSFYFGGTGTVIEGFVIQNGNCGISNPLLHGSNTIINNIIRNHSTGIFIFHTGSGGTEVKLSNNLIINNGVGVEVYGYGSYNYFGGCYGGGGYAKLISTNDTIVNNQNYGVRSHTLSYCTADNIVDILNGIITDNFDDLNLVQGGTIEYSNVGGGYPGFGNISLDPRFWDAFLIDHGLMPGSSCIDAGDPDPVYNDPDGTRNDMGFTGGASVWFDSDYDGMADIWESYYGFSPRDPTDAFFDNDSDGLINRNEYFYWTNPNSLDSDADGIIDGLEVNQYGSDPIVTDTDDDGLSDAYEAGILIAAGPNQILDTTPNPQDSVHDSAIWLGTNMWPDTTARGDDIQVITASPVYPRFFLTDPTSPDSDNDGIDDMNEVIYGADPLDDLITPSCKIGPDILITGAWNSFNSSLVWTGIEYGVIWEQSSYEIYFSRVSAVGAKIGADLRVTNAPGYSRKPSMCWTGSEFATSWDDMRDGNEEIYFARISAQGDMIGSDYRITYAPSSSKYPSIAWTGSEFGVSWHDRRDGNKEIYFSRISASGGIIGPDLRLTYDSGFSSFTSLTWTGSEFGVSWIEGSNPYFTRVNASGAKIGDDLNVSYHGNAASLPSLIWTGSEFGLSWIDGRNLNKEIYFARISASGEKIGDDLRVTRDENYSGNPSLFWSGSDYGVSWHDDRDGNYEIYFSRISFFGSKIAPDFRITFQSDNSLYPSLAFNGYEFGMSWRDDRSGGIYFTRLSQDIDGDRLLDSLERNTCTDEHNYDTDFDGLPDGVEDANHNGIIDPGETDPCDHDTDDDGLSNHYELNVSMTDPLDPDSDGDGMDDGWEVSHECTDVLAGDSLADADSDSLTNIEEYAIGTDPCNSDTDGDGLSDGYEVKTSHTDPLITDTDGDGMNDGDEVAAGRDPTVPDQPSTSFSGQPPVPGGGGGGGGSSSSGCFMASGPDLAGGHLSLVLVIILPLLIALVLRKVYAGREGQGYD